MVNLARFTIGASPSSDRGFDVNPGDVPVLRLEASSTLVKRTTFEVHSAAAGAPRSTSGAPTLTLNNGSATGQSVDAITPGAAVTISNGIPVSRAAHLWEVRCIVNGGVNLDGSVNPDYVFSRFIAMRSARGSRKIIASERNEYDPIDAWAGAFNELVESVKDKYSVRDLYGAIGNGIADDYEAIQSALDDGGVVYLPEGKYNCTRELIITRDNTILIGDGPGLSIICTSIDHRSLPNPCALYVGNTFVPGLPSRLEGVKIIGIEINGDPRLTGASPYDQRWFSRGLVIDHSHMVVVHNVEIEHCEDTGLRSSNVTSTATWGPDQPMISLLKVSTCGRGIDITDGHSWHFSGGLVDFCDGVGVRIADINSVFFEGFDIEQNGQCGVDNMSAHNVVFDKCTFESNGMSLAVGNDERVHIRNGSYSHAQTSVTGCFLNANSMRALARSDNGDLYGRCNFVCDHDKEGSWTGSSTSAIIVWSTANDVDFDDCGVSWPAGVNKNVRLTSNGRNKRNDTAFDLGTTRWTEDFGNVTRLNGALTAESTGVDAGVSNAYVTEFNGCAELTTGSTATGESRVVQSTFAHIRFGHGRVVFAAVMRTQGTLSSSTQRYRVLCGMVDSSSATVNGAFVTYTDSENSGKLQLTTMSGGAASTSDTGVTVAINTTYIIVIEVSADRSSVRCYINGVLTGAPITTNIPAEGVAMGALVRQSKLVGTNARNIFLSKMAFECRNNNENFYL